MNQHTPAPWEWAENYNGLTGPDQEEVLTYQTYEGMWLSFGVSQEANARLIAAAPDLLEALQDMLSGWKYIRETHGDLYGVGWDRAQEKAEKAIAKATGESNG